MLKQDFLNKITEIGALDDPVEIRTQLAALSEDVGKDYDRRDELETTNKNLSGDNEKLRSANMQLFLRVGETKSKEDQKKNDTGIQTDPDKKRKFEDLFDEKGGLK